jgi:hypothetical protein
MSEQLETILWLKSSLSLRPRKGALRGSLSQSATTGNFGIRLSGWRGSVLDCEQPSAAISPARPTTQKRQKAAAVQNLADFSDRASEPSHSLL